MTRRIVALLAAVFWVLPASAQMGPIAPTLAPPAASTSSGPGLAPPVSALPQDATRESEDQMRAKGLKECKVGDRVVASQEGQWVPAMVIAVDAAAPYPCRVRLIGRPPSLDASFAAWMLRPETR